MLPVNQCCGFVKISFGSVNPNPEYVSVSGRRIIYGSGSYLDIFVTVKKPVNYYLISNFFKIPSNL
jgi:hypothetical protein